MMKIYCDDQPIQSILSDLKSEMPAISLVENTGPDVIYISNSADKNPDILVSSLSDHENINLLGSNKIQHLIGNAKNIKQEIKITLDKISTKNIWGIEKYLSEDALIKSKIFHHSKDIPSEIEELINSIDYPNFFNSPKDHLRLVLNELLLNSFFHQEELEDRDRRASIFELTDSIEAKIGIDEDKVLISVSDKIGSINKSEVVKNIIRGFNEKAPRKDSPGAGLGLYLVYQNINQLIINKKESQMSEFICIIEANKRYKKFKERVTSFHFFEEE